MTTSRSLPALFRVWFSLGLQSFGGGSATRYLIWQAAVERYGWISDEEFTRFWAMCQLTPGINLLALTTLIGWRLAGLGGVLVSLFGLLFPSVTITMLITAMYAYIRNSSLVQHALQGIVPATVGMGLIMVWRMFDPLWRESRRDGRAGLGATLVVVLLSIGLMALHALPVFGILIGMGVVYGVFQWLLHRRSTTL